jgi:hypothetical protein
VWIKSSAKYFPFYLLVSTRGHEALARAPQQC